MNVYDYISSIVISKSDCGYIASMDCCLNGKTELNFIIDDGLPYITSEVSKYHDAIVLAEFIQKCCIYDGEYLWYISRRSTYCGEYIYFHLTNADETDTKHSCAYFYTKSDRSLVTVSAPFSERHPGLLSAASYHVDNYKLNDPFSLYGIEAYNVCKSDDINYDYELQNVYKEDTPIRFSFNDKLYMEPVSKNQWCDYDGLYKAITLSYVEHEKVLYRVSDYIIQHNGQECYIVRDIFNKIVYRVNANDVSCDDLKSEVLDKVKILLFRHGNNSQFEERFSYDEILGKEVFYNSDSDECDIEFWHYDSGNINFNIDKNFNPINDSDELEDLSYNDLMAIDEQRHNAIEELRKYVFECDDVLYEICNSLNDNSAISIKNLENGAVYTVNISLDNGLMFDTDSLNDDFDEDDGVCVVEALEDHFSDVDFFIEFFS